MGFRLGLAWLGYHSWMSARTRLPIVLAAAVLLSAVSCTQEHVGQRLLTIQIELDGDVVFQGIRGVPDDMPNGEMWKVLGSVSFETTGTGGENAHIGLSVEAVTGTPVISLEGDVVVRIKHVDREMLLPIPLERLSLKQEGKSFSSWFLEEVEVQRIWGVLRRRRAN